MRVASEDFPAGLPLGCLIDDFFAVDRFVAGMPGFDLPVWIVESFNARLRDELLDGEIFYTLKEAQIVIESWRRHYNAVRPHASLGYKPPAPEVFAPALAAWPSTRTQTAPTATLPLAPGPSLN